MKRLMNFLRGMVTVVATGPFPERLMNLCAQERLDFWGVEWPDGHTMRLTTRRVCVKRLRELAQRAGCEVTIEGSRGLPDFLLRFQKRYAFLVGLVLCLLAVGVLSRFVLSIQVTGNEQVPTAVILNQLRQLGVRPGVYGPSIPRKQVAEQALLKLPELSWMAINRSGTRLEVSVREARREPERIDEGLYCDIVAEADGLVTHIQPELGDAVVKNGDTVVKGDLLISGIVTMEPPEYSDLPPRYYRTHARGRVWARTWRTLTAVIPTTATVKEYTGKEKQVWSVEILGRRIEIFGNSSISQPFCDKITKIQQGTLPVALRRDTIRPYTPKTVEIDLTAAQELLEGQLRHQLEGQIGEGGEICAIRFTAAVKGERLEVTAHAECVEDIAQEIPGTGIIPDLSGRDAAFQRNDGAAAP